MYIDDVGYRKDEPAGRKARGEETRSRLLAHARELFANQGFAGTRFDAVSADLGLTAGAMYHHFHDKRNLFLEAVRQCHSEIAEKVEKNAESEKDLLEGIVQGCLAFITEAAAPRNFRLLLIDGIAVLGWEDWKKIDAEFSERALAIALEEARKSGLLPPDAPVGALARFLSGGTNELALWVHYQGNRKSALKSAERTLRILTDPWRKRSGIRKNNPKIIMEEKE